MKTPKSVKQMIEGTPENQEKLKAQKQIQEVLDINAKLAEKTLKIASTHEVDGVSITCNGHNQITNIEGNGITPELAMKVILISEEITKQNLEKAIRMLGEAHAERLGVNLEETIF